MSDDIYFVFLPSSPSGDNAIDKGALVQKWIKTDDEVHYDGHCVMPTHLPTGRIPTLEKLYRGDFDINEWPTIIRWTLYYYKTHKPPYWPGDVLPQVEA